MNRILIAHLGEQSGWHVHQILLGIIFAIQSAAFQCACNLHVWPIIDKPFSPFSPEPAFTRQAVIWYLAGLALVAIGFGGKFAATWSGGLEMYYCKDMFFGRDIGTGFVASGIFALIKSPMYGVGNLQLYGLALLANDWLAALLAAVFQISINVFDHFVEQPFVRKTYGSDSSPTSSTTSLFDD
jgi:protein-S-isoprenylcysteine O-methyltransferase Ste14